MGRLIGIIVAAALLLGSCGLTPQGDLIRDLVKDKGAQVFDEGLTNAEWFVCESASIGSIKRRYGTSSKRIQVYNDFCTVPKGSVVQVED